MGAERSRADTQRVGSRPDHTSMPHARRSAPNREAFSGPQPLSPGLFALQRAVGNSAVSALMLGDAGRPLTHDERSLATADPGAARLHSGPAVEHVARALGA